MPGFWICFRYLNTSGFWIYHGSMPGLHRVPNIPEYGWIIPGYAWLYLNLPRSVWMAFFFTFTHCTPLSERNHRLFSSFFVFCFWLHIFTSKISNLQLPLGGYLIPNEYIWCFFNDLFTYFVAVLFPLFVASKDLIRDSQRL